MRANEISVRAARDADRRPLATLFAAVADERDGIAVAAIDWARERGLHKLALGVFPHNKAAIALYCKFGFVQEGRLVRHIRRADGQLWDLIEMGLLL